jgi:hypothetical protein
MEAAMIPYVTPDEVDALFAKGELYVSLPLGDSTAAAEFFNRMLDQLQGEQSI